MFGRIKILGQLLKTGRLALRLARDSRVPMATKLILGGTLLYLVSPIDVVPDWLPLAGQADDVMVVLAGLNMFIKACPSWLVREHGGKLDRERGKDDPFADDPLASARRSRTGEFRSGGRRDGWDDAPVGASGGRRRSGEVIEGEYRRV
jgi:uncharacterized membrane protein YkvA (DUF1232 family)